MLYYLINLLQVLITGDVEYSDPQTRKELLDLHEKFENLSFVADTLYSESWMRGFFNYIDNTREYIDWNITSEESFISSLRDVSF